MLDLLSSCNSNSCRQLRSLSDDESMQDKWNRAKKIIPAWAEKRKLAQTVEEQKRCNPEGILGGFAPTCDLKDMFGSECPERISKYVASRPSREWGSDAITSDQIERFNTSRGFR